MSYSSSYKMLETVNQKNYLNYETPQSKMRGSASNSNLGSMVNTPNSLPGIRQAMTNDIFKNPFTNKPSTKYLDTFMT